MNYRLVVLKLLPSELENYRQALALSNAEEALRALARALLVGQSQREAIAFRLRLRHKPSPVLGFFGDFDEAQFRRLTAQGDALRHGCRTLHYVGLERARQDCARLAQRLTEKLGRETLDACRFVAVPRGGMVVLGLLAYALGLRREQLELDERHPGPWVVVDDCCLSGSRCAEAIERYSGRPLVFAHLYSHPDLRSEVEKEEAVLACAAAWDLSDFGPALLGERYAPWRTAWHRRLEGRRFWVGVPEALAFAWSEPDRSVYVSPACPMEKAWKVVPAELCMGTRWSEEHQPGAPTFSEQEGGVGPIRVGDNALYLERDEEFLLGDLASGDCLELAGSAPRIWTHLLAQGSVEAAARALASESDVSQDRALRDTQELWRQLAGRGLLVRDG